MKVIRDPQLISGFVYEEPFAGIPSLTHCGEGISIASHTLPVHTHRGFELLYCLRGPYTWRIASHRFTQNTGDLFICFPRQPHATGQRAQAPCHHLWMGVDLAHLGPEPERLARELQRQEVHCLRAIPELEPVLRGIVQQAVLKAEGREAVVRAYLHLLVCLLKQRLEAVKGGGVAAVQKPTDLRYSHLVLAAMEQMHRQLHRRITLDELAQHCGCGVSQLCRQFRAEVGQAPVEYHLGQRLIAARLALLSPDSTIAQIAAGYGFSSSQHFSTAFLKAFGLSPGEWQRCGGT